MVRMANVYADEGCLESAFILYMKFMTLFLEKIRSHPEFSGHSSIDKTNNTKKLKEILPKAENLKTLLREKYQQEYNVIVKEQKRLEEELKAKQLEQQRQAQEEERRRQLLEEENQRRKEIRDEEKRIKDLQSFHHNHPKNAWSDAPPDYNSLGSLIYPTSALTISDGSPTNRPSAPLDDFSSPTTSPSSPSSNIQSLPSIPSRELKPMHPGIPAVDRSNKPTSLLSATVGVKSGGLREVVVPVELMSKFMNLAQANTLRNIETCGVLAGRLTHPTQTAFLSSVDLHTHCSYQLMMPEAVAIVCAPKYDETGYFTLTHNHGLAFIANCQQSGFHPHPKEPPLFQKADHVTLDHTLPINVIDLRDS
ncbi:STAM-binding protein-like isoform X2 [Macrobrachium rosenbergii]|uniref:STAM-binding protein-like isoform X2 n=1 Tax=Macrobrachium rosenbergii TaxID=79674 RepID=UPI0034D6230F